MKTWIKQPAATWTGNSLNAPDGIVVEDDKIVELVDGQPSGHCDAVFDAANCVLLPGLINCHHHFYQTLTRALPLADKTSTIKLCTSRCCIILARGKAV